jgi:hypothetical protein
LVPFHAYIHAYLQVADRSWLVLREHGAIVEEAVDDEDDGSDAVGHQNADHYREKKPLPSLPGGSFDEKAGFHGPDSVIEIRASEDNEGLPGSVESGLR